MNNITVQVTVNNDRERAWKDWTDPEAVKQWAFASDDWECPYAENDLKVGGKFLTRMGAKDGSVTFDFSGTYTEVLPFQKIAYTIEDGRKVEVIFEKIDDSSTRIVETFEMENENSEEKQRDGWQAILENYKKYSERNT